MILTKWGVNYNFKATTALCRKAITYTVIYALTQLNVARCRLAQRPKDSKIMRVIDGDKPISWHGLSLFSLFGDLLFTDS